MDKEEGRTIRSKISSIDAKLILPIYMLALFMFYLLHLLYSIMRDPFELFYKSHSLNFWFGDIIFLPWAFSELILLIPFSGIILICYLYLVYKDKKNIKSVLIGIKNPNFSEPVKGSTYCFFRYFSLVYVWAFFIHRLKPHFPVYKFSSYSKIPPISVYPPITEEFNFRVLFIGVPLIVLLYYYKKEIDIYNLLGGFGYDDEKYKRWQVYLILVISSIFFGIAHFQGRDNSLWYFTFSFVGGLILGHLYIKEGLYMSILLHFAFNYEVGLSRILDSWENLRVYFLIPFLLYGLVLLGKKAQSYINKKTDWCEMD